jgi:hypothetical protein
MLNCGVDHILQEFYTLFLAKFRTYKIATPPPHLQMTSKDDIKGLVSLSSFVHAPTSWGNNAELEFLKSLWGLGTEEE